MCRKEGSVRKAYKFRLYPKKETEQKLNWTLSRCRELYNAGLSERRDAYRYANKSINRMICLRSSVRSGKTIRT